MVDFLVRGGPLMFFVALFGLAALGAAAFFARAPEGGAVARVASLSLATVSSSLADFFGNVGNTLHLAAGLEDVTAMDRARIVMTGFYESTSPLSLGFALVAATWLVMALGFRRLAARTKAPQSVPLPATETVQPIKGETPSSK
jgi:hypothetical protein